MRKSLLINGGTHGTEKIGLYVIESLKSLIGNNKNISYNIAHPEALAKNVRFLETDLNRSFPGRSDGSLEERIAFMLQPVIKSYDVVVDIHSTESGLKSAIILTKVDDMAINLVRSTNAKYVLIMDITKDNAFVSSANIGIGFEYGADDDPKTLKDTVNGIALIMRCMGFNVKTKARATKQKKCFRITESIPKPEGFVAMKNIKNYKLVLAGQVYAYNPITQCVLKAEKDFYPIIFNEPRYTDIFGFMGQRDLEIEKNMIQQIISEEENNIGGGWQEGFPS